MTDLTTTEPKRQMTKEERTTYSNVCAEVRNTYNEWAKNGVKLFLLLRKIELSGVWELPGFATFGDFLKAEFPLSIGITRYNNVIRAIEVHGEKFLEEIGVHSAHVVAISAVAQHPERIRLVQDAVQHHMAEKGVAPNEDEMRRVVKNVLEQTGETPRPTGAVASLLRDRQQKNTIDSLREQLKRAQARIRELEGELRELHAKKKGGGAKNSTSRKPSGKPRKSKRS